MAHFLMLINTLIFTVLALWHFYWAFGGVLGINYAIPAFNKTVPDQKETFLFQPRASITFIIGIVLLLMGMSEWLPREISIWSDLILMVLFLARAMGDFNYVGLFKKIKTTTFSHADTYIFVPLCLFLAMTHAILLWLNL